MTRNAYLDAAGVKTEKEFYKKFPTQETFFNSFPQYRNGGIMQMAANGMGIPPQPLNYDQASQYQQMGLPYGVSQQTTQQDPNAFNGYYKPTEGNYLNGRFVHGWDTAPQEEVKPINPVTMEVRRWLYDDKGRHISDESGNLNKSEVVGVKEFKTEDEKKAYIKKTGNFFPVAGQEGSYYYTKKDESKLKGFKEGGKVDSGKVNMNGVQAGFGQPSTVMHQGFNQQVNPMMMQQPMQGMPTPTYNVPQSFPQALPQMDSMQRVPSYAMPRLELPKKAEGGELVQEPQAQEQAEPQQQQMQEQQQQGGGQEQAQQIIAAYAQMKGIAPEEIMKELQKMKPQEQQQAIQQMMAEIQQQQGGGQQEQPQQQMPQEQQMQQPQMAFGGQMGGNEMTAIQQQQYRIGDVVDISPDEVKKLREQGYQIDVFK